MNVVFVGGREYLVKVLESTSAQSLQDFHRCLYSSLAYFPVCFYYRIVSTVNRFEPYRCNRGQKLFCMPYFVIALIVLSCAFERLSSL